MVLFRSDGVIQEYKSEQIRQLIIIQIGKIAMQNTLHPITPQKKSLSLFLPHEETLMKELSPQVMTVSSSNLGKIKLQMMLSPLPTTKDLFSQLLATEKKPIQEVDFQRFSIMEEESMDQMDQMMMDSQSQEDSFQQDQFEFDQESDSKKRKRKSAVQLRILKAQLTTEGSWDKDKIADMAEATGLSQSQVYKWWWDQKKKSVKYEKEAASKAIKKKLIRKQYSKRPSCSSDLSESDNSDSEEGVETKIKNAVDFQWNPDTDKKINKRLTFA